MPKPKSAASSKESPPSDVEAELARASSRLLAASIGTGVTARLRVSGGNEEIVVPAKAMRLLVNVLEHMGDGRAVTVLPVAAELTTQQAANFLNVSRPHLVAMLERGELPFRRVGKHRRVGLDDVLKFRREARERQDAALQELSRQAQDLDMGY